MEKVTFSWCSTKCIVICNYCILAHRKHVCTFNMPKQRGTVADTHRHFHHRHVLGVYKNQQVHEVISWYPGAHTQAYTQITAGQILLLHSASRDSIFRWQTGATILGNKAHARSLFAFTACHSCNKIIRTTSSAVGNNAVQDCTDDEPCMGIII
jgi:hypothetical protein